MPTPQLHPVDAPSLGAVISQTPATNTLYGGGVIFTMVGPLPTDVDVLVEHRERIVDVGPPSGAIKAAGPANRSLRRVDQAVRTLLPGFIDTQGHFICVSKNLIVAELFGATTVEEIVRPMQAAHED